MNRTQIAAITLLILIFTSIAGAIAYGFTTFATIDYSDKGDAKIESSVAVMRQDVRELRNFIIPKQMRRKE